MRIISDIEIHSRFARACSPDLTIPNIGKWADIKGVDLIGTGDFTHPKWREEIKQNLTQAERGLYKLKDGSSRARFILSCEVSCIFSEAGKVRRVHLICLVSSIEAAERFAKALEDKGGKLAGDGRPILGMTCQDVLSYLLEADEHAMLIPAHVWTPYFGLFGSKSGFDSVEEAFGDMSKHIYALETGLSSDPDMNWAITKNDRFTLVSSSDAHSLPRIGREANVMEIPESELSYKEFTRIIKEGDKSRFKFTIEYFPEEGRYHLDGHSDCDFVCLPEETKKRGGRCPKCGKKITVGVMSRVQELSDKEFGRKKPKAIPGRHLVPLEEVLSECAGVGVKTKTVQKLYRHLIERAGNEFQVILDLPIDEVKRVAGELIAEAVKRVREEDVKPVPGFDGRYGVIKVFGEGELDKLKDRRKQASLF
jgi:uncharacterized protein (TIGR00375 family)